MPMSVRVISVCRHQMIDLLRVFAAGRHVETYERSRLVRRVAFIEDAGNSPTVRRAVSTGHAHRAVPVPMRCRLPDSTQMAIQMGRRIPGPCWWDSSLP
jgi:hypothetical protein